MREYRKTATVFARKVETDAEVVHVPTLEGPAIARPGDYICRANTAVAEEWVVAGEVFEATYVLV